MSPELIDTIQTSPLTPWIGGALLIFLAFTLIKFVAQTIGKLICTAVVGLVGFLGWNWWGENEPRGFSDIGQEWFASVKTTDFSKNSIQALVQDTGQLLKEATEASRAKGREVTKAALKKMAATLQEKMDEASAKGENDARREFERLHDDVMARLQ